MVTQDTQWSVGLSQIGHWPNRVTGVFAKVIYTDVCLAVMEFSTCFKLFVAVNMPVNFQYMCATLKQRRKTLR